MLYVEYVKCESSEHCENPVSISVFHFPEKSFYLYSSYKKANVQDPTAKTVNVLGNFRIIGRCPFHMGSLRGAVKKPHWIMRLLGVS